MKFDFLLDNKCLKIRTFFLFSREMVLCSCSLKGNPSLSGPHKNKMKLINFLNERHKEYFELNINEIISSSV